MDNSKNVDSSVDQNASDNQPDYKNLYIRSLADYDNMRKYMEKRMSMLQSDTLYELIGNIISPVYNDIYRGVGNGIDGLDLILKNINTILEKYNISVIGDDYVNEHFDVNLMEAVTTVPTHSPDADNLVKCIVENGFINNDTKKTITFAKVVVFKYMED